MARKKNPSRETSKPHAESRSPGQRQPPPRPPERHEAQPRQAPQQAMPEGWIPD